MQPKTMKESRTIQSNLVLPYLTNNHQTLFGGQLMSYIDGVAALSAVKHSRKNNVTASTDSVDFLHPIPAGSEVTLISYVSYTGKTSMEIFVKVITEHLHTGDRKIAATAFLTFVALDQNGKPSPVPPVIPETDEEKKLFETALLRIQQRKERKKESEAWANLLTTD